MSISIIFRHLPGISRRITPTQAIIWAPCTQETRRNYGNLQNILCTVIGNLVFSVTPQKIDDLLAEMWSTHLINVDVVEINTNEIED